MREKTTINCTTDETWRTEVPKFEVWERATLDKFAYDTYAKLLEQADLIQQLQNDLKDAIEAYRELMRRGTPPQ